MRQAALVSRRGQARVNEVELMGGVEEGSEAMEAISPGDVACQGRGVRVSMGRVEMNEEVVGEHLLGLGEGGQGEQGHQAGDHQNIRGDRGEHCKENF